MVCRASPCFLFFFRPWGLAELSLICCCKSGCFLSFVFSFFFLVLLGGGSCGVTNNRCSSYLSDKAVPAVVLIWVVLLLAARGWFVKLDGKGCTWCIWVVVDLLVGSDDWRLRVPAKLFRQWTMSLAHYEAALPSISFLLINYRSKRTSKRKEEGEASPLPPAIVLPLLVPRSFLPCLILTHLL